jgi:uncharacterized damage-inducible protein DinB
MYISALPQEQFVAPVDYSIGSVRNHAVHLMEVDAAWFSDIGGLSELQLPFNEVGDDRQRIRQNWDAVELSMRRYLGDLKDDMLLGKPITEGEDKDLILWQILLHVVNHATDHRAQLLRIIHEQGLKTGPQDYVFYLYDQMS